MSACAEVRALGTRGVGAPQPQKKLARQQAAKAWWAARQPGGAASAASPPAHFASMAKPELAEFAAHPSELVTAPC